MDPVPERLLQDIEFRIRNELLARQLLIHQKFSVHNLTIRQERSNGSRRVTAMIRFAACISVAVTADMVTRDAQGRIIRDTKAERIAEDLKFIGAIADAAEKNALVGQLLQSYHAAVDDPKDEFVHLEEIREALKKHYGSDKEATRQLGFSSAKWGDLGKLTNGAYQQSRHRGLHKTKLHPATADE